MYPCVLLCVVAVCRSCCVCKCDDGATSNNALRVVRDLARARAATAAPLLPSRRHHHLLATQSVLYSRRDGREDRETRKAPRMCRMYKSERCLLCGKPGSIESFSQATHQPHTKRETSRAFFFFFRIDTKGLGTLGTLARSLSRITRLSQGSQGSLSLLVTTDRVDRALALRTRLVTTSSRRLCCLRCAISLAARTTHTHNSLVVTRPDTKSTRVSCVVHRRACVHT